MFSKPKTLLVIVFCSSIFMGCSAKQIYLGQEFYGNMNRKTLDLNLEGTPRILLTGSNVQEVCSDARMLPVVRISGRHLESDLSSETYCDRSQDYVIARFRDGMVPGNYRVHVTSSGLRRPHSGVFLFLPRNAEQLSGPDRRFQAANELTEGVNEASLNSSAADRTDWWVMNASQFKRYSILFSHDAPAGEASVQVFRLVDEKLESIREIQKDQTVSMAMHGQYFFRVRGRAYGRQLSYHIAMRNIGQGAAARGSATERYSVLDSWPISATHSAVLISISSASSVTEGDSVKIFSKETRKLIDECRLISVSNREAECHIQAQLPATQDIEVRGSL